MLRIFFPIIWKKIRRDNHAHRPTAKKITRHACTYLRANEKSLPSRARITRVRRVCVADSRDQSSYMAINRNCRVSRSNLFLPPLAAQCQDRARIVQLLYYLRLHFLVIFSSVPLIFHLAALGGRHCCRRENVSFRSIDAWMPHGEFLT